MLSTARPTMAPLVSSIAVPGWSAGLCSTTTRRAALIPAAARNAAASAAGMTMLSCGAPAESPRVAERTTSQTKR